MASYNKNNLFGIKGRIGELILMNYLKYKEGLTCVEATAEEQKIGIDFYIQHKSLRQAVDAKLSDKLGSYFAYAYHNGNNLRHPARFDTSSDRIMVNTFDWETYVKHNMKSLRKNREELEKALGKYVEEEELEVLVGAIAGSKKKRSEEDILHELKELYIAHRTCDKLEKEFGNKNEKSYKNTKNLFDKGFVISIKSVPSLALNNLTFFMKNDPPDGFATSLNGSPIARKKTYWTRFGSLQVAEVFWGAVAEIAEVYYEKKQDKSEVTALPQNSGLIDARKVKWPYRKSSSITIDEKDKTLEEMKVESLEWLKKENKNYKSSFRWKYDLDYQEFDKLLDELIKAKRKSPKTTR